MHGNPAYLTGDEQILSKLCDFMYEGDWRVLKGDLDGRKRRKPVIPRLFQRIDEDLERIAVFQRLERKGVKYAYDSVTKSFLCLKNQ